MLPQTEIKFPLVFTMPRRPTPLLHRRTTNTPKHTPIPVPVYKPKLLTRDAHKRGHGSLVFHRQCKASSRSLLSVCIASTGLRVCVSAITQMFGLRPLGRRAPYLFDGLTTCDQRLKKPSPLIPLRRMLKKYVFPPHSFLCVFWRFMHRGGWQIFILVYQSYAPWPWHTGNSSPKASNCAESATCRPKARGC